VAQLKNVKRHQASASLTRGNPIGQNFHTSLRGPFFAAALLCICVRKGKKIIESSLTFFDCETADIIAAGSDSSSVWLHPLHSQTISLALCALGGAESETWHDQPKCSHFGIHL
jgi:hypothetical protein